VGIPDRKRVSKLSIPKIPIGNWVESLEAWMDTNAGPLFDWIKLLIGSTVNGLADIFNFLPPLLMILIFTAIAYFIGRFRIAIFTLLGLLLVFNLGYWEHTMETLALVLIASFISIVLGVPLGILCARHNKVQKVVTPVLDFMQTMPAFVYLLPAVAFFSLGVVPGVIASVIFSIPPTIRLTNLGIRQVSRDLVEAADAFGSTPIQKLFKLQLPIAKPTIMAGINQTIMLSLSMVVIASMIGAQGVGADVYRAVTQAKTGVGFEAGLAVVVLAIILDRLTQNLMKKNKKG
jgi:glycine betaine/proline transport system permease protein